MPAAHQIATEAAESFAADVALKAGQFRESLAKAKAGFSLTEATAAATRVILGLYGLAFIVHLALSY